jgi:hypothetical protein
MKQPEMHVPAALHTLPLLSVQDVPAAAFVVTHMCDDGPQLALWHAVAGWVQSAVVLHPETQAPPLQTFPEPQEVPFDTLDHIVGVAGLHVWQVLVGLGPLG